MIHFSNYGYNKIDIFSKKEILFNIFLYIYISIISFIIYLLTNINKNNYCRLKKEIEAIY